MHNRSVFDPNSKNHGDHNRKSAAVVRPCETCIKSNTKINRRTVIWGSVLKTQQPLATGAVHPNMQIYFALLIKKMLTNETYDSNSIYTEIFICEWDKM